MIEKLQGVIKETKVIYDKPCMKNHCLQVCPIRKDACVEAIERMPSPAPSYMLSRNIYLTDEEEEEHEDRVAYISATGVDAIEAGRFKKKKGIHSESDQKSNIKEARELEDTIQHLSKSVNLMMVVSISTGSRRFKEEFRDFFYSEVSKIQNTTTYPHSPTRARAISETSEYSPF